MTFSTVFGDVVFFKGEKRKPVEGKVSEADGKVIVESEDGTKRKYDRSSVDRIVKGKNLLDIYGDKLAIIENGDTGAMFELALWCESVGLFDKKAVLMVAILRIDPDNERVHRYLGHLFRNGRWIRPGMGDAFGENIENTLTAGDFVDHKGKRFTVRTDTSPKFAKFVSDYLDKFCDAVALHFKGELNFKKKPDETVMIIFSKYGDYTEYFRDVVDSIVPEKQFGFLRPRKDKYVPPEYSCFLDPKNKAFVTYRYKRKPNIRSLAANVRKLAGYGMYVKGLGAYGNLYKSARFLVEGFSEYISLGRLEGKNVVLGEAPDSLFTQAARSKSFTVAGLFDIDPLSYYTEDMRAHTVLSWSLVQFMLSGERRKLRKLLLKAIKKDASGGLRKAAFKAIIRKSGPFEQAWGDFFGG